MITPSLKSKRIAIDDLFLDPNNPRFIQSLKSNDAYVSDSKVQSVQSDLRKKFTEHEPRRKQDAEEDEFFGIKDLVTSMKTIGFVPIDRVVVRQLQNSDKYLVIEGNRRICAAKTVREWNAEQPESERLDHEREETLREIDVLLLESDGLSRDELEDQIGVILGLRHYGSVLEWQALPKATNIHYEYMRLEPRLDSFRFEAARINNIADRLSIKRPTVKAALKTYLAYTQLKTAIRAVQPDHYTLIGALVNNTKMTSNYLSLDVETFRLSEESVGKLDTLCQFSDRDQMRQHAERDGTDERILRSDKAVRQLAAIVSARHGADKETVRKYADVLLAEIESSDRPLDEAYSLLRNYQKDMEWVDRLRQQLDRQEGDLPIEQYSGQGNDAMRKDELKNAFKVIRAVLLDD